jgi:hypothetical protein
MIFSLSVNWEQRLGYLLKCSKSPLLGYMVRRGNVDGWGFLGLKIN